MRIPALLLAAVALTAMRDKPREFAPTTPPAVPAVATPANGAIFQASVGYAPLTSGYRAAAVGDMLLVVLTERTNATKSSAASNDRDGDIGISPPISGPLSAITGSDLNMGGKQSFKGGGQASQSNGLFGDISVTVAEVYPNGTMLVRGEKMMRLNRGDEFIRLSGLVRTADIGPDNRVPSTRVADARISYTGRGQVARASKQGWMQRFFSKVSPF